MINYNFILVIMNSASIKRPRVYAAVGGTDKKL